MTTGNVRNESKTGRIAGYLGSFLSIFTYCLAISWRSSRFYTSMRVLTLLFMACVGMLTAFLSREILNTLAAGSQAMGGVAAVILLLILLALIKAVNALMSKINEYCVSMHNDGLSKYLEMELMAKSVRADIQLFDSPAFYDDFAMAQRSVYSVINVAWNAVNCFSSIFTFIATLVLIGALSPWMTLLLVATILPSAVINQLYTRKLYNFDLEHIKEERQMGYLYNVTTNRAFAQDIRLYNIGDMLREKYQTIWTAFFSSKRKLTRRKTVLISLLSLLPEVCTLAIIIGLSMNIMEGRNSVGDYTLYIGLIAQLTGSVNMLSFSVINIYGDKLRIDSFRKLGDVPITVKNEGARVLARVQTLEFKHVTFRYPDTDRDVLKDVSFIIKGQERVCLVGVNGAGKTTTIKLILRFYDATEGEILINGRDIREYELTSLRRVFSCFFQTFANYAFTMRENVTISDMDKPSSDELVMAALQNGDAMDIFDKAPDGLDSFLTRAYEEDGMELSGGQHQKLALARAFYRDSSVILLDEPSASLDPEAEHRVFENLEKLCRGKMTVFTSHRLSNTTMADRIIVIEDGRVVEDGTHEELMRNPNRYAKLFNYQAEKYVRRSVG